MIRGLSFCAIACCVAAPAAAGERSAAAPAVRALPTLVVPVAERAPTYGSALSVSGDFIVRLHGVPATPVALADFENRTAARPNIAAPQPIMIEHVTLASPFAVSELHSLRAWRLTDRLAPVTATANGSYAVRDTLADYRKPRAFRPSALSAMLVLRIDGKDESAPFSVGGGGVAAALWRVRRQ